MTTITITQALRELNLLDKRITSGKEKPFFIFFTPNSKDRGNAFDGDKFSAEAKANYQSVRDLIKRRADIKREIVKSNASTMVNIGGVEMTVAEAIELKSSIGYKKSLLSDLERGYLKATREEAARTKEVEANILSILASEGLSTATAESRTQVAQSHRNANLGSIAGIEVSEIDILRDEIDSFESSVDTILTISNSTTNISI